MMVFTKEDEVSIKFSKRNQTLWSKVKRFLSEFRTKPCTNRNEQARVAAAELNSSRPVFVSIVTQVCEIFAAHHATYLDKPLTEISQNYAVHRQK